MTSWEDIYDEEGESTVETENLEKLFICISLILMFGTSKDALNFFRTSRRFSSTNKNLLERIKENEYSYRLNNLGYQTTYNPNYIERSPFSRLNLNWRDFRNPRLLSSYDRPGLIGPTLPKIKAVLELWNADREEATNLYGKIGSWDVSKVENMEGLFKNMEEFNEDISGWNVSNVTNMKSMFEGCKAFNQPIGSWNVSNVRYMKSMFKGCKAFNQDISDWEVNNVIDGGNRSGKDVFKNCRLETKLKPKFN